MSRSTTRCGINVLRSATVGLVVTAVALTTMPPRAEADMLGGLLIGGGLGAVVGGIIGGSGGMAAGALIGGTVGAVKGDQVAKSRARARQRSRGSATGGGGATSIVILETQKALVSHGFDPGTIDGFAGANTRSAIEAYQRQNGLLVTGQTSDALLKHMLQKKG